MKKIVSLLVLTAVSTAFGQIQAVPAAPADNSAQAPAATGQAPAATAGSTSAPVSTASASTAAPAKSVSTSVTTAAKKEKPKSPWSGSFLSEIGRGANINHSKVLDADHPEKRTDASLLFAASLKYTASKKNSFSVTQVVTKDIVRNEVSPDDNQFDVKNLRVGWTRSTDMKLLGSGPVALPFSVSLPTRQKSRELGFLGGLRFKPSIDWELNPTFSLNFTSTTDMNFVNPPDQAYKNDLISENSQVLLNNSVTLNAAVTDSITLYQSLGTESKSQNIKNLFGMDQLGAQMDVGTGINWNAASYLNFDFSVGQSSPIQGTGYLATKVYEDNEFKLYHEAQTGYTLDITYIF